MKNFYVKLIVSALVLIGIGYLLLSEDPSFNDIDLNDTFQDMNLRIEFIPEEGIESQEIRVLNDDNDIIFQLTIDELNQWTEDNWGIFEEEPEVGGRSVDSGGFGFFDRAASISPNNQKIVFSVSDYAVATTISFVFIADFRTEEMSMINEPTRGGIENYYWSEDSSLIAYTTGTGRARGDFLFVDNVIDFERNFTLEERDLLEILDPNQELIDPGQFMPVFEDLEWVEDRLHFTTEHPENNQVRWSINRDGIDLQREDFKNYESFDLGISFRYPFLASINYEEGRVKVTYVGDDSQMAEITDGFTFFIDAKDKEGRSIESIAEEEFEKRTEINNPIEDPHQTEINDKNTISFKIEGGLNGEHTFFVFEDNNKVIITSQFIADPHGNNYEEKIKDILLSIKAE